MAIQIKTICENWECRRGRRGACEKMCVARMCSGYGCCFNCKNINDCAHRPDWHNFGAEKMQKFYIDFEHERMRIDADYREQLEHAKRAAEEIKTEQLLLTPAERRKKIKRVPTFESLEDFYKWLSRNERVEK